MLDAKLTNGIIKKMMGILVFKHQNLLLNPPMSYRALYKPSIRPSE
jgi:hypothetical protein